MENLINLNFFIRIGAAVLLAFCIGLERELTNKYAGLRTHIMVALGACIFTLISIYGFPTFAPGDNVIVSQATGVRDTSRVAAQIVTGIGFIGAGTVLRNGPIVLGLTTAATLWIAASIGMACGAGMFDIAFAGTLVAILTLVIIRVFERKVLPKSNKRIKNIRINLSCPTCSANDIFGFITENYSNVSEFTQKKTKSDETTTKISCVLSVTNNNPIDEFYRTFKDIDSINSITIQEINE